MFASLEYIANGGSLSGNFARGTFDDLELHQAWVSEHRLTHDVCFWNGWWWTAWDRKKFLCDQFCEVFVESPRSEIIQKNTYIPNSPQEGRFALSHQICSDGITSYCKVQKYAGCYWVGLNYTVSYDVIPYDVTVFCIAVCSIVLSHMVFPYRIECTILWICSLLW